MTKFVKLFICIIGFSAIAGKLYGEERLPNLWSDSVKSWKDSVKKSQEDVRFYGLAECKIFVKKGTIITNNGSLVRIYPEGIKFKDISKLITANRELLAEINKLNLEKGEWFPMRGSDSIEFNEDMTITIISRKAGLIELTSKAGGYPVLVLGTASSESHATTNSEGRANLPKK